MSCTGLTTGDTYSSFGRTRVCVDLSDPATLREVKSALQVLTGVKLNLGSALWNPQDELTLQLWSTDESVASHDVQRAGPLNWSVPSGAGIEVMVQHLTWSGVAESFPRITAAVATAGEHWFGEVETSDPRVGVSKDDTPTQTVIDYPVVDAPQPPPEPTAELTQNVFPSAPRTATEQSVSAPNYRNVGLLVGAVGILAAFAYYMRG